MNGSTKTEKKLFLQGPAIDLRVRPEVINDLLQDNLIKKQTNEDKDLAIFTYTREAQFDRKWNPAVRACRGLIVDNSNYKVVARPFHKFFNYEEHLAYGYEYPEGEPKVYEKADGSLGILYYHDRQWKIATKGSFESEQAQWATNRIAAQDIQKKLNQKVDSSYTYLFEIIYPENRIVVDYGNTEELVLLGRVHKYTGMVEMPDEFTFVDDLAYVDRLEKWEDKGIEEMLEHDEKNREGFILRWPDYETIAKIKLDTYLRWHRIVTELNMKEIWRYVKNDNDDIYELLENVPDEFDNKVREYISELRSEFVDIKEETIEKAEIIEDEFGPEMRDIAIGVKNDVDLSDSPVDSHMIFMVVKDNEKRLRNYIWKTLKPKGNKLFNI